MTMHETWVEAKKRAWKEFKEAHKNYLKEQDRLIKEKKDPKARQKALDIALGDAGLDKGETLDDYLKFSDGFGKSLDTLEKAVENNRKLAARYDTQQGLDKLLKDKDYAKVFMAVCQKTQSTYQIMFYLKDHTKPPQQVYDEYLGPDAAATIDLSTNPALEKGWQDAAADPNQMQSSGKKLVQDLREHVKKMLFDDIVIMKMGTNDLNRKALGYVTKPELEQLKKQVRDTAMNYDDQVDKAAKRWKDLQPQFWVPLDDALREILKGVADIN